MNQIHSVQSASTHSRPVNRIGAWWLLLLLLLVTALAVFWLSLSRAPAEGSPEVNFSRDMAAHHAQAVEMALIARDRSSDEELRRFALDIMLTQQAQIGQMQGWLAAWGRPLTGAQPTMQMPGMATQQQINQLQTLPVAEMETSFLQLMIRHHQGGIMMAEDTLRQTKRAEVVQLAQAIVNGQQSEIDYMQDLLKRRGAAPPAPAEPMNVEHLETATL